ncbi:short-chain dehydrogenase/reductase SDR [Parafrankia sp. EAN1pec]|uniref:SDR family NAD(P)-dependent oxidoreductase n=1 Tax=Parafrankia sp. (strain EAN1pec) TaxID=298653 RepID=UPI00005427A9|nr:short-chain dehydrogenase/reductase SDR [Frankia sp. EAN1pec]
MRTIVITGGTDGIGQSLARTLLGRGDQVVVVGRNAAKGTAFLDAANRAGAGGRAFFLQAELSLVSENERVVASVTERFAAIDGLVLGARHYRSARRETSEGFEENFALFYLSRYVLGHGLTSLLEKGANPVIVNIAGPGADISVVRWDDLQLRRFYHGGAALGQGGKLNDLLGVAFVAAHEHGAVRQRLGGVPPGSHHPAAAGPRTHRRTSVRCRRVGGHPGGVLAGGHVAGVVVRLRTRGGPPPPGAQDARGGWAASRIRLSPPLPPASPRTPPGPERAGRRAS